jgi:acyl-CoA synthetase (AMP-forming)/AMP-acid ligase II
MGADCRIHPGEHTLSLLPDQLRFVLEDHPDEVGYEVIGKGNLTFADWGRRSSLVAHWLLDHGLEPGDRVSLLLEAEDALHHFAAYVGVHKAGGVNVPTNPRLAEAEVVALMRHAEPRILVCSPALAPLAAKVQPQVPSLTHVLVAGDATDGAAGWDEVLGADDADVQVDVGEDGIADIIYTSGTTGLPKGVLVRHRTALQMPVYKPDWHGKHWFHASPLFTFAGLAFTYVPMQLGMTGVYLPRFDADVFCDLAEKGHIQMAFLVPAMVQLILARPDVDELDLSRIEMVSVGSAPIAPASLQRLNQLVTNGTVANGFAMTESGAAQVVLTGDEIERKPGSVGKPMPPTEVRVVDEAGNDLPVGAVGEILLRNPGKEREYYRQPEETGRAWRDGWLHTGDLGHLDEDGYLFISGRMKDVIIRGGNNIHAADVEAVLFEHDGVAEAAVVGVPHDVLGEDVGAVIVVKPGASVTAEELAAFCKERLASYKVPRHWRFAESLPRNATGKVLKREVRESF